MRWVLVIGFCGWVAGLLTFAGALGVLVLMLRGVVGSIAVLVECVARAVSGGYGKGAVT